MKQYTQPWDAAVRTYMWAAPATLDEHFDADIAVLGLPFGDAYEMAAVSNDQSLAPAALRAASAIYDRHHERYDFDFGGTLFDGRDIRFVDCGDIASSVHEPRMHYALAEQAARLIASKGALLITLGGDHGVTIPILRGLDAAGPLVLVHVDAHLDWRDEVNGVREGYSSPIRRASEMPHVGKIIQIGLRAQGSARPAEIADAIRYGATIVTADAVHDAGVDAVLSQIPDGARYYLSIDADGLDPTVMPAVAGPAPGGLTFLQVRRLVQGLVRKGRVVGMDVVEITPTADINRTTCVTANRIIYNLIGSAVRENYFAN
jgi:agmatinase